MTEVENKKSGRRPSFSEEDEKKLVELLKGTRPLDYNLPDDGRGWTRNTIISLAKQKLGKSVCSMTMGRYVNKWKKEGIIDI